MADVDAVVDQRWQRHEVSILIAASTGVGRCIGSQPRAKVSMIIMRPPQQGCGRASMRGSSSSAAADLSGCSERDGTASNSRACVGGTVAAGQQPVVTDAVEAAE
jgi:hypothetical protein